MRDDVGAVLVTVATMILAADPHDPEWLVEIEAVAAAACPQSDALRKILNLANH